MADISFKCGACGKKLVVVDDELVGTQMNCPYCDASITIPTSQSTTTSEIDEAEEPSSSPDAIHNIFLKFSRNASKPEEYAPVEKGVWHCPSCDGKNPDINIICRDCGQPVRHTQPPSDPITRGAEPFASATSIPSQGQNSQTKRCPFCAEEILAAAIKCKHCGSMLGASPVQPPTLPSPGGQDPDKRILPASPDGQKSDKRILPAFLLYLFLGLVGGHHFYAGRNGRGFFYICCWVCFGGWMLVVSKMPFEQRATSELQGIFGVGVVLFIAFLVFLILYFIDFIQIITGSFKDGEGRKITKWT